MYEKHNDNERNSMNKELIKDLLFALELGVKVLASFGIMTYVGIKLNSILNSKIYIFISLIVAFIYVMKLLLGVGKHE